MKSTGYPLHSPVSPSLPLPCVTACHHISARLYRRAIASFRDIRTGHAVVNSTECPTTLTNNLTFVSKNTNHAIAQPVNHRPSTRKYGNEPCLFRVGVFRRLCSALTDTSPSTSPCSFQYNSPIAIHSRIYLPYIRYINLTTSRV